MNESPLVCGDEKTAPGRDAPRLKDADRTPHGEVFSFFLLSKSVEVIEAYRELQLQSS